MFSNLCILQVRQLRLGKVKNTCPDRIRVEVGTDLGFNSLIYFLSTLRSSPYVAQGVGTGVPNPEGRDGPSALLLAAGGCRKLWLQV